MLRKGEWLVAGTSYVWPFLTGDLRIETTGDCIWRICDRRTRRNNAYGIAIHSLLLEMEEPQLKKLDMFLLNKHKIFH